MKLTDLSDEELVSNLHALVGRTRTVLAYLLEYLGEVEERRLDLKSACSSMFEFCVRRLGMSEDEACRRVAAARLVRRFPMAVGMIERGEIHLTTLLLLREHLDEGNHEELLREASGKTKMQVQELIAARSPRPDAPSKIVPMPVSPAPTPGVPAAALPAAPSLRLEPLAPERYKVQFTASAELRDKIARATDLMRHANPSGDLAVMVERAVDLLIAEIEKRRLGKTERSAQKPRKSTRRGYVPRATRRQVFERDGERCTHVDDEGRRCEARTFLELDHLEPRARGGTDDVANLAVKCRRHNGLAAERAFGRAHVERKKAEKKSHPRQRGSGAEVALRALCGMGFKEAEARRALGVVAERVADQDVPIAMVVREAISLLT